MWNRRATCGAAIALGIAALLAACSDPSPTPSPTTTFSSPSLTPTLSPTSSPTPSVDPTIAAAEAAIAEAYRGYWDVKVKILADPTQDHWQEFSQFAVDVAQTDVESLALSLKNSGIAIVGKPVLDPAVKDIVPNQRATVVDCVDSTNWQPVFVATGKSAAQPGQALRVVTSSEVIFYNNGWVVRDSVPNRNATC